MKVEVLMMQRFQISVVALLASLLVSSALRADDPAPADLLKDKGLVKQSNVYILTGEADVVSGMRTLRVSRRKLDEELKVRQGLEQRIKLAENMMSGWQMQLTNLDARLATTSDPGQQNQIIGAHNALVGKLKQGSEEKKRMEEDAAKVGNKSKEQFAQAVLALAPKGEAVSKDYQDLGADDAVKAAIAKVNETARPKMRLGPSPEFTAAATLLKKWRSEVEDETIPLKVENETATVEVTLNGDVIKRMIVDSGASIVSLPAELADELKMSPGPNDPVIRMSVADGRTVDGHLMHLKSVRVGRFTVENVECVVMPRSATNVPPLLGNSFLSHFVVKLDVAGGELRLLELAGASKDVKSADSSPGRANPTKSK